HRVPEPSLRGEAVEQDDGRPRAGPPGRREPHAVAGQREVDPARRRVGNAQWSGTAAAGGWRAQWARPEVVWTIRTSHDARWLMLAGTEPSSRPARLLSPRLPTTHRSALRSSAACTSTSTGSPALQKVSTSLAPAFLARSAASRRMSSAGCDPTTL